MRDEPIYEGADLSGLKNIQSSAFSWDDIKRLRDLTKMKMVIKGILAWEDAKIAAATGIDAIIVSNHGGRADEGGRSTIETLPEIIEVLRQHASADQFRLPPRHRYRQSAVHGRQGCRRRPALFVGSRRIRPARRRARAATPRTELKVAMQQAGAPSLKDLKPSMVVKAFF